MHKNRYTSFESWFLKYDEKGGCGSRNVIVVGIKPTNLTIIYFSSSIEETYLVL
ncbi:MAG: hypothetical protein QXO78_05470 [Desulfurococcaceae archaeon]